MTLYDKYSGVMEERGTHPGEDGHDQGERRFLDRKDDGWLFDRRDGKKRGII